VEFGAWDGIYLSNCRYLFEKGWRGVFIEADVCKYRELENNYKTANRVICINEFVSSQISSKRGLKFDDIADLYFPTEEIDFLSIDVDGLDYNIFQSIERKPKVVCIEGGFAWHPDFHERVPDFIAKRNLQQPLAVMIELGRSKGYIPVCFNQNTIFVLIEYAHFFCNIQNDAVSLWRDAWNHENDDFRKNLLRFRKNSLIRSLEGDRFQG
jgi:hypothetical protein